MPTSVLSDSMLVAAMANGDSQALAELYDRYASTLLAVAHRMLAHQHNAEDLVQDVFMEAWRSSASYSPQRGGVRTWLLLRLRSRAIDRLRLNARRRVASLEDDGVPDLPDPAHENLAFLPDHATLRRAIETLPKEQRQALELAYFKGLTASEIAASEDIPIGTVKSRLAAALRKLREHVRDDMWGSS